jgi:hypothetical protein
MDIPCWNDVLISEFVRKNNELSRLQQPLDLPNLEDFGNLFGMCCGGGS